MDMSGQVKRREVNRRVGLAWMEGKKPGAKKSFTQLYGVSCAHGVRGNGSKCWLEQKDDRGLK